MEGEFTFWLSGENPSSSQEVQHPLQIIVFKSLKLWHSIVLGDQVVPGIKMAMIACKASGLMSVPSLYPHYLLKKKLFLSTVTYNTFNDGFTQTLFYAIKVPTSLHWSPKGLSLFQYLPPP